MGPLDSPVTEVRSPKLVLNGKARNRQKARAREYVEGRLARHEYVDLAEILHGLETQFTRPPSRSTFYQWVKEWREARARDHPQVEEAGADPRQGWQFEDGDAAIVLPMVAAVAEWRDGGIDSGFIDRSIAEWARRIGREFPDTPPIELYFLASEYLMATVDESVRRAGREKPWLYWSQRRWAIDLYLAFAPWRDAGERYVDAFEGGLVQHVRPLRTPSTYEALDAALPRLGIEPIEWMGDLPVSAPVTVVGPEAAAADEAAFSAWEQGKRSGARAGRRTRKA